MRLWRTCLPGRLVPPSCPVIALRDDGSLLEHHSFSGGGWRRLACRAVALSVGRSKIPDFEWGSLYLEIEREKPFEARVLSQEQIQRRD